MAMLMKKPIQANRFLSKTHIKRKDLYINKLSQPDIKT